VVTAATISLCNIGFLQCLHGKLRPQVSRSSPTTQEPSAVRRLANGVLTMHHYSAWSKPGKDAVDKFFDRVVDNLLLYVVGYRLLPKKLSAISYRAMLRVSTPTS
jgi:hypothetical protein